MDYHNRCMNRSYQNIQVPKKMNQMKYRASFHLQERSMTELKKQETDQYQPCCKYLETGEQRRSIKYFGNHLQKQKCPQNSRELLQKHTSTE